jgi:xylose dehydrogenase (NAD/NADP)
MDTLSKLGDFSARDWSYDDSQEPIRLAVIGLGAFTRSRTLPAIEMAAGCEATVAVSSSPAHVEAAKTDYGIKRALSYEEYHNGVGVEAYDAVYVATPNALHLDGAETAARLGKHVLCEKPIEVTAERAREMIRVCENAGVTLMIAYRMQLDPVVRRLRTLLDEGVIGNPIEAHGSFSRHVLEKGGVDQWRLDPKLAGGGALMDLGIYPLNTTRFVLGVDPTAITATTTAPDEGFSVDEHVGFELLFPGDTIGSFTASFGAYPGSHFSVLGTEGRITIDPAFDAPLDRDVRIDHGGSRIDFIGAGRNEIAEELDYFATCIREDIDPEPNGDDGLTDLRILDAAYESAETGTRVEIE